MNGIGAGLRDHVDDAAGAAAELRVRAASRDLEFLYRFQRDVNRGALAAHLLAEESVVVVAAIQADVIENAALAVDIDFVAVRPLRDTHSGRQCQQIFKLAAEHRRRRHGNLVQRGRRGRFCDFHDRHVSNHDLLRHRRNFHRHRNGDRLPDGQVHVLLNDSGKAGFADGQGVAPWRKAQEGEMSVGTAGLCLHEIGCQILCFDGCARNASALLIKYISLDASRGDLRLCPTR